jgi:hypothetical protein
VEAISGEEAIGGHTTFVGGNPGAWHLNTQNQISLNLVSVLTGRWISVSLAKISVQSQWPTNGTLISANRTLIFTEWSVVVDPRKRSTAFAKAE